MSFRFNFGEEKNDLAKQEDSLSNVDVNVRKCVRHDVITDLHHEDSDFTAYNVLNDVLYTLNENLVEKNVSSTEISASLRHSDLVAGQYEGGLKVWECTNDLLYYMCDRKNDFTGKRVLDLGCGAGLLGVYAMKYCNSTRVCLQDYNDEVIECFTCPTVRRNIDNSQDSNVLMLSGDWSNVMRYFCDNEIKFDVILTSETIYNVENYLKLHDILQNSLNVDGYALVAAKSFYFGVGGGVVDFIDFVKRKNHFNVSSVWKNNEGLSREILKLVKK